jgi:hypothetical protein
MKHPQYPRLGALVMIATKNVGRCQNVLMHLSYQQLLSLQHPYLHFNICDPTTAKDVQFMLLQLTFALTWLFHLVGAK